jgi:hypothetical protein
VEFVDLRRTEVQKEIVQHSPAARRGQLGPGNARRSGKIPCCSVLVVLISPATLRDSQSGMTIDLLEPVASLWQAIKKSDSGVLASLRGSTYGTEHASPLCLLRPCWVAFLSILRGCSPLVPDVQPSKFCCAEIVFPQPARGEQEASRLIFHLSRRFLDRYRH